MPWIAPIQDVTAAIAGRQVAKYNSSVPTGNGKQWSSSETVQAPKADVVTTKPTGGRLPMTVDNLQMFAEKPKVNLVTSKDNHFNNWLNKGSSNNSVYYGIYGKERDAVYTGITKQDLESRLSQHNRQGKNFVKLNEQYSDLTRNQARAVEQYLIENGHANQLNKINSISPKNKMYDEAMKWAEKYLNGGN